MRKISASKSRDKTRNLEESRKVILNAAFFKIYEHGFQGVSIDDIVAETPYTKGAFYHLFPTKLDLGYALMDEVIGPMIIQRWIEPIKKFENPVEGIINRIKVLIGNQPLSALKLGCPLNNLAQEMSPLDKEFRRRIERALNLWVDELSAQLKRGQKNGWIKKEINTKNAALFIVMAHEGFYGTIKALQDDSVFKTLFSSLKIYLEQIQRAPQ